MKQEDPRTDPMPGMVCSRDSLIFSVGVCM